MRFPCSGLVFAAVQRLASFFVCAVVSCEKRIFLKQQ
jgi:hypothetical protein